MGVLPPLSTVSVFLEHNTRKGNGAGFSEAEVGGIPYYYPVVSPGNGLSVCHICWQAVAVPVETGV